MCPPQDDWDIINNINISGRYATYKEALYMEKRSTKSSDSESEVSKSKRKIKLPIKYRDTALSASPSRQDESDSDSISIASSNDTEKDFVIEKQVESRVPLPTISESNREVSNISNAKTYIPAEETLSQAIPGTSAGASTTITADDIRNAEIIFNNENQVAEQLITDVSLKDIFYAILRIEEQLKVMSHRILQVELKAQVTTPVDLHETNLLPTLPFNSIDELLVLEESLKNDNCSKQLFVLLKYVGGITEKNCIYRCLEKLFTNFVAQFCSWTGKKNNFKLQPLICIHVLKSAVQVTFPNLTEKQFEEVVMAWFRHAKQRFEREEEKGKA